MWRGYDKDEIGAGVSDFFYATNPPKIYTGDSLPNPGWVARDVRGKTLVARQIGDSEFFLCLFSSEVLARGFLVAAGFLNAVVQPISDAVDEFKGYARACINPLNKKHWDAIIELRR